MGLEAHLVEIGDWPLGQEGSPSVSIFTHIFFSGDKPGNSHDKGTRGLGAKNKPS